MDINNNNEMYYEYLSSCSLQHFNNIDEPHKKFHYIKTILNDNIINIRFVKKNGDIREMCCTLFKEYIPEHKLYFNTPEEDIDKNRNVLVVYDLKQNDWRSFNINNIIEFEYVCDDHYESLGIKPNQLNLPF